MLTEATKLECDRLTTSFIHTVHKPEKIHLNDRDVRVWGGMCLKICRRQTTKCRNLKFALL